RAHIKRFFVKNHAGGFHLESDSSRNLGAWLEFLCLIRKPDDINLPGESNSQVEKRLVLCAIERLVPFGPPGGSAAIRRRVPSASPTGSPVDCLVHYSR